jgi:hypothetical protein
MWLWAWMVKSFYAKVYINSLNDDFMAGYVCLFSISSQHIPASLKSLAMSVDLLLTLYLSIYLWFNLCSLNRKVIMKITNLCTSPI